MEKISYAGYRFPPEIIDQAIWLYLRFTLSLRDVEDLLAERGVAVSYETVRRWVNHFGPMIAADLRKRRQKPHTTWHLDEVYLKIDGRMVYLWRAVDAEGEVLDVLVQSKRNKHAALKLMRKLLRKYAFVPERLVTDDLRSYGAASETLGSNAGMSAGDGRTIERRITSADAAAGAQDAAVQERGFSPEIPVNACRRLQHLQRPTSSHFSPNAPRASRCGDGHMADRRRSSLTIPEPPTLRARPHGNVTIPRPPLARTTRKSATGAGTPLSSCAPRSSATNKPAVWRCTFAVTSTRPWTRAATFGVSPNTSPAASTTTGPELEPDARQQFRRALGGVPGVDLTKRALDGERRPHSALGVVLLRRRVAEESHQPVAEPLQHVPAKSGRCA